MLYLLFLTYFIIFCLLIKRLSFFRESGLSSKLLIGLFTVKVAASILVSYVFLHFYEGSDVAFFHKYGLLEHELLLKDPRQYVENFFYAGYSTGYSGFFATQNSYWNNLSSNVIIKMLSLFNFISAKNVYINTLLFNFLVFFAPVALYRVFTHAFAPGRTALVICLFLLPSAIVFTSIVHKEGLIFIAISLLIFHLYFSFHRSFSLKSIILILFFLLLIFALRNYIFLALLPAVFCWLIAVKKPQYSLKIFGGVYLIIGLLFFTSPWVLNVNLMELVTVRREAFLKIAPMAATALKTGPLDPAVFSFIQYTPSAIINSIFKPQLWEHQKAFYLPFKVEVLLFELLLMLIIIFRKKSLKLKPVTLFFIFFSLSVFLITGFTIPILGAIVRYRSIYYVFAIAILVSYIDWKKLSGFNNYNKCFGEPTETDRASKNQID